MTENSLPPFALPAVQRKKVTAAVDGGRPTSDGSAVLLAEAERRLGPPPASQQQSMMVLQDVKTPLEGQLRKEEPPIPGAFQTIGKPGSLLRKQSRCLNIFTADSYK